MNAKILIKDPFNGIFDSDYDVDVMVKISLDVRKFQSLTDEEVGEGLKQAYIEERQKIRGSKP